MQLLSLNSFLEGAVVRSLSESSKVFAN